jgi:hypothetical protein
MHFVKSEKNLREVFQKGRRINHVHLYLTKFMPRLQLEQIILIRIMAIDEIVAQLMVEINYINADSLILRIY